METTSSTDTPHPTPPVPPKKRRRPLRWLLIALGAAVILVLLTPFALSLGPLRSVVHGQLTSNLRGDCEIDSVSFSWFSGVHATGLRVANPPGFPAERPAVAIDELRADVSLFALLSGTVSAKADITGLRVNVDQKADGTTNLQALTPVAEGGEPGGPEPKPGPGSEPKPTAPPGSLELDLRLRNAEITVRREGKVLEALTGFELRAFSAANESAIQLEASGKLTAGELDVKAAFDPDHQTTDAKLVTKGLDLGKWQPLIDSMMPDQITALAGRVDGQITARIQPNEPVKVDGDLVVLEPRLAGAIVQGMDLRANKWQLHPTVAVDSKSPTDLDTSEFKLDFEWLQLNGTPATKPGEIAFGYALDVAQLAEFGGPIPELLKKTGTRLSGRLQLPTKEMPADVDGWIRAIGATANLQVQALDVAGFALRNVGIDVSMQDGAMKLATTESTLLDDGSLIASFDVDLKDLARMPTNASLKWKGGKLTGGAVEGVRYLVPLLAGLDADKAEMTGGIDLELKLSGPAMLAENEEWLTWLDKWQGNGSVGLLNTTFAPSKQLQGLLEPLGALAKDAKISDKGKLKVDKYSAPFSFDDGTIEAKSAEWQAGGDTIALTGKATLDGKLDYALDLSGLLRGHSDGRKVLEALGGKLNAAKLTGTLDDPKLGLPEVEDIAKKLLENKGGELIKKGLKGLFGK